MGDPVVFTKKPQATLNYSADWSNWLCRDSILSADWTVAAGLESELPSFTETVATIRLKGGTDGEIYAATCHIVTANGLVDEFTIYIRVVAPPAPSE
jgi:hypothetical protein